MVYSHFSNMEGKDISLLLLAIGLKDCIEQPCDNAISCTDRNGGGVTCKCIKGYAGDFCESTYHTFAHLVSMYVFVGNGTGLPCRKV